MVAFKCKNCSFENPRWRPFCRNCQQRLPLIISGVNSRLFIKAIFAEEFEVSPEAILQVIELLPLRQRLIIVLYFGLDGKVPIDNMAEIGRDFFDGLGRERIRVLRNKALRFLRHPSRSAILVRAKINHSFEKTN